MLRLQNYALGEWVAGTSQMTTLVHAVTGEAIGETSSHGLDFAAMTSYARTVAGPKLRAYTFHQRALMLKRIAISLMARKDGF